MLVTEVRLIIASRGEKGSCGKEEPVGMGVIAGWGGSGLPVKFHLLT